MLFVFDTETTSMIPGQIAQIGYLLVGGGTVVAKNFYFTVEAFDAESAAVNDLDLDSVRVLSGGERFCARALEILDDYEACDCVCAHNVRFDLTFLRAEFGRLGVTLPEKAVFDTMRAFTDVCRLPRREHDGYKYPKLAELSGFFGHSEERIAAETEALFGAGGRYHDARFDTTAVYLAMKDGARCLPELAALFRANGIDG